MRKYLPWFGSLLVLIVGFGTVYAAVQQSQRNDANWPQIQIAEDTADQLDQGLLPEQTIYGKVDAKKSLASFSIAYDKKGNVVTGSGYLDGKVPKAPLGVLKAAKGHDYHAVSWQPQKGVRIAAVAVASKDYYVLSGRNLKEVEKNENTTLLICILGGLMSVALLGFIYVASGGASDDF